MHQQTLSAQQTKFRQMDLAQLQARFASTHPEDLHEFWLSSDGRHALIDTDLGQVSLQPEAQGLKLTCRVREAVPRVAAWLNAPDAA